MRCLPLTLALLLLTPATAAGDGLPIGGIDVGKSGVAAGGNRYVTLNSPAGTSVARIQTDGGRVRETLHLDGQFTIPAVALDGTADGLSADRRTLVLIEPRPQFPRRETRLVVLDAGIGGPFRVRKRLRLDGDFSYDALSPDGRTLFLINYISRRDPRKYRVRSFDLKTGRMDPEPIVDPSEPPDEMNGYALSRVTSRDGRWAYTLYDGDEHPFVHVLDTVGRKARCVDLHDAEGLLPGLTMEMDRRGRLVVSDEGDAVVEIDTVTFETSVPPYVPPRTARSAVTGAAGEEADWELLIAPAALFLAGGALTARARRRRAPRTARG